MNRAIKLLERLELNTKTKTKTRTKGDHRMKLLQKIKKMCQNDLQKIGKMYQDYLRIDRSQDAMCWIAAAPW